MYVFNRVGNRSNEEVRLRMFKEIPASWYKKKEEY